MNPGHLQQDLQDLEEALVPGAVLLPLLPATGYHCYVYDSLRPQDLKSPRLRLIGTSPAFVVAVVPVDRRKKDDRFTHFLMLEGWAYVLLLDAGGPFWIGASAFVTFVIEPPYRVLDRTNGPRGLAPSTGPLMRPQGRPPKQPPKGWGAPGGLATFVRGPRVATALYSSQKSREISRSPQWPWRHTRPGNLG